jgi:hypothetical protein
VQVYGVALIVAGSHAHRCAKPVRWSAASVTISFLHHR